MTSPDADAPNAEVIAFPAAAAPGSDSADLQEPEEQVTVILLW